MPKFLFALTASFLLATSLYAAPKGLKPPSAAEIAKMKAAMPSTPPVKPAKPRKVLIVSQCEGYKHASIPYAEKAFEILGRKTGAFTTAVVNDCSFLESPKLDTFDAILMDNTTIRVPLLNIDTKGMTAQQKAVADAREAKAQKRFLDFVRNGKGIIGVHAATDCLYKWPEYGELMGGYFWGHPWNERVTIKLDDPGHPLLEVFNGQPFTVTDEIYQFRDPYSRDKLRVLLSLDVDHTNMKKNSIHRKDNDFPVAWIHEYGKGRAFYFSLGHHPEIFWNPAVMRCYLAGIQYALGDLKADATPSSQLTPAYLAASKARALTRGVERIFAELRTFSLGGPDTAPRQITNLVVENQNKPGPIHEALCRHLAVLAADKAATVDARVFACRQLRLIGDERVVPVLAALLKNDRLRHPARLALEAIPGPSPDKALLAALPECTGVARAGIIDSLAQRSCAAAVPALVRELRSEDPVVAEAAINALGRIGGADAARALLTVRNTLKTALKQPLDRAILACAESARLAGKTDEANTCYDALSGADVAPHIRGGAVYGKALMKGAQAAPDAVAALRSSVRDVAQAGARLVAELPGKSVVAAVCQALPSLPVRNRILAVDALATRGDRTAQDAVLPLVKSKDVGLQTAALRALESLGDAKAVGSVLEVASNEQANRSVRNAAHRALDRMNGPGVDKALIGAMANADTATKIECVRAFGARKARAALPILYKTVLAKDPKLAKASCKAVARLVGPSELPRIVDLLIRTSSSSVRSQLENTLVTTARRVQDENEKTRDTVAALKQNPPKAARISLLTALGRIGAKPGLPMLEAALHDPDVTVRKAVVRTLADNWPDADPIQALRAVSRSAEDPIVRVLALRGYARMLALPSDRPMAETLRLYKEALGLAKGAQEKRTLISGLGRLAHPDALAFLKPFLTDKAVQEEALLSAVQVMENLRGKAMTFDASTDQRNARNSIDGNPKTRWTTGKPMHGGEWFQVGLPYETGIKDVFLDAGPIGHDEPRGWEVYVSRDGKNWGDPVAKGKNPGKKAFTITFPPKIGRFVKIVQTGSHPSNFWSVNEIRINGLPEIKSLSPIPTDKWKVSASRSASGTTPENAIDGDREKRWGTGGGMKPTDWFMVDMGEEHKVYRVVMDAAKSGSDYPREYRIYTSMDGKDWYGPIGAGKGESALTTAICLPTKARFVKIAQIGEHKNYWWSMYDLKIIGE